MLRIGIDVGGTFTDLVAVGEEGSVTLAKAASTPADPSLGVMEGLERLAEALGAAVDRIARSLGVGRLDAALGIHRIVNTRMAEGIRLVSVRRGVDPRRFALLAFGGAAALHVTEIARQLELKRVVLPRLASVLSAWGMLASDLRYEVARSHVGDASRLDADALRALYADMEAEGRRRLADAAFVGEVLVHRFAEMRYGEQIFEVGVDLDGIDWQAQDLLAQLAAAFHRRHEELYTYALLDQEAVLVNARVAVIGRLPALPQEPRRGEGLPAAPHGRRRIWLGDWHEVLVFDVDALRPGQIVEGPAIVESATTTALLRAGDRARATAHGWLDIAIATPR